MTSTRQRPGRASPPLSSREAALVGALTAFAKAPRPTPVPRKSSKKTRQAPIPGPKPSLPFRENAASEGNKLAVGKAVRAASYAGSDANNAGQAISNTEPRSRPEFCTANSLQPSSASTPRPRRQASAVSVGDNRLAPTKVGPATPPPKLTRGHSEVLKSQASSTTALLRLFEKQGTTTAGINRDTPLKSPKPTRRSTVLRQEDHLVAATVSSPRATHESDSSPDMPLLSERSDLTDLSSPTSFRSARDSFSPVKERKTSAAATSPVEAPLKATNQVVVKPRQPPRRVSQASTSGHGDHVSPPGQNRSRPPISMPYLHTSAASSSTSITATYHAMYPRRMSALRTGDSLADAIVASSLASSRGPSPSTQTLSAKPLRSRRSHHGLFSRTPSPHKHKPPSAPVVLKSTLRTRRKSSSSNDSVSDDPYAKHKRKRHLHRHANKYHEGDRKRWRNVVTARERTRYEGVWAANRGGPFVTDEDGVHAFAVREIWNRSRLPGHVLGEIWDLVAVVGQQPDEEQQSLGREAFVVGLWLVDQRLKGRKLPLRVADGVWESVRVLKGIRLRHGKKGGR